MGGLDVLIVIALGATAICAHRHDPSIVLPAIATATLLVADAVMDVSTANRSDLWQSLLLAVVLEIPVAVISIRIAWQTIDALNGAWPRLLLGRRRSTTSRDSPIVVVAVPQLASRSRHSSISRCTR